MKTHLQFDGVTVDLKRNGDSVTGLVTFPEAFHRSPVAISFRATDDTDLQCHRRTPDARLPAAPKGKAIAAYRKMIAEEKTLTRGEIAKAVAKQFRVSTRSLQRWNRAEAVEGATAMIDRPGATVAPMVHAVDDLIDGAVFTCAWWSFRINNLKAITMHHVAQALQLRRSHCTQDILGAIDGYYGYKCDRDAYPFKPFARWAKYDFHTWLHRARHDAQFKRARDEVRKSLRAVKPSGAAPRAPDPTTRKRDVAASSRLRASSSVGFSPERTVLADVGRGADQARAMGLTDLAHSLVMSTAASEPETIQQALTDMSDGDRVVILKAAQRDPKSRAEAIAIMPLWFEGLSETVRNNIEFRVQKWQRDHTAAKRSNLAGVRFDIFLKLMQTENSTRSQPRRLGSPAVPARGVLECPTMSESCPMSEPPRP